MISPYYQDLHNTLYNQDFRKNDLPDESIQCVVTSPPYWGLRKYYGEQELIWGGDKKCEHEWMPKDRMLHSGTNAGKVQLGDRGAFHNNASTTDNTCSLCGAWKGAYGLEPTPEMYIEHTIEILREIRRVLRKDGVVFWNIGDSYNGSTPNQSGNHGYKDGRSNRDKRFSVGGVVGLKPKDLCLIPFRVAISAQSDGWWVRSVIIWSKPNPMPESVTDRPTESHEYILMLTKSKKYYWDADAVREPHQEASIKRDKAGFNAAFKGRHTMPGEKRPHSTDHNGFNNPSGRNIRSVWTFPTQPYPEAHFAVFPEKLPELCIKAATPEVGCCSKCGAPWERITETKRGNKHNSEYQTIESGRGDTADRSKHSDPAEVKTIGWQPTCKCNADKVPSIVLDPFAGAGTTLWVAKKLNRKAVGYEISEEYCQLTVDRLRQQAMRLEV